MAITRNAARTRDYFPKKQVTKRSRSSIPVFVQSESEYESSSGSQSSNTTSDSDNSTHVQESEHEVQSTAAAFTLSDPDLFDCPICTDPLSIPVYECEDGHFACVSCRDKIRDKCPSCRKPIGYKRCRGLESVLEYVKTSCQNMEHGCMERISYCKKLDHENSCEYAPVQCPHFRCKYVGVAKSFYGHYAEKHPDSCKLITFNNVNMVDVGEKPYLLLEKKEKILFFLSRAIEPIGSFVCVSTVSKMKFSYVLTAGDGEKSVSMKSIVEIMPKCFAKPDMENCLLITDEIRSGANSGGSKLRLQLVIRKVSL